MNLKFTITLCLLLGGCASSRVATLPVLQGTLNHNITVIDERSPKEDPSYLANEGNIYSCNFGIKRVKEGETAPERLEYLKNYLSAKLPQEKISALTVERFDIYVNIQAQVKHAAPSFAASGALAGAVNGAVHEIATHMGPVIGCAGESAGEYWQSEASGSYIVAVTFLEGNIDGKEFKVRSVNPEKQGAIPYQHWDAFMSETINNTIDQLVSIALR